MAVPPWQLRQMYLSRKAEKCAVSHYGRVQYLYNKRLPCTNRTGQFYGIQLNYMVLPRSEYTGCEKPTSWQRSEISFSHVASVPCFRRPLYIQFPQMRKPTPDRLSVI